MGDKKDKKKDKKDKKDKEKKDKGEKKEKKEKKGKICNVFALFWGVWRICQGSGNVDRFGQNMVHWIMQNRRELSFCVNAVPIFLTVQRSQKSVHWTISRISMDICSLIDHQKCLGCVKYNHKSLYLLQSFTIYLKEHYLVYLLSVMLTW